MASKSQILRKLNKVIYVISIMLLFGCGNDQPDTAILNAERKIDQRILRDSLIKDSIKQYIQVKEIVDQRSDSILQILSTTNGFEAEYLAKTERQEEITVTEEKGKPDWMSGAWKLDYITEVKKKMILSKSASIISDVIIDTIYNYYKPVLVEKDSSKKVKVDGEFMEIANYSFNTDTLFMYDKPLSKQIGKILNRNKVHKSDRYCEGNFDQPGSVRFIPIVDEKNKKGYWLNEYIMMVALGENGRPSDASYTIFLRETGKPKEFK